MQYEKLPEELASKLEKTKVAAGRFSTLPSDNFWTDILLLDKDTVVDFDQLHGYTVTHVKNWYEFVSRPYGDNDEKCLQLVEEALKSV